MHYCSHYTELLACSALHCIDTAACVWTTEREIFYAISILLFFLLIFLRSDMKKNIFVFFSYYKQGILNFRPLVFFLFRMILTAMSSWIIETFAISSRNDHSPMFDFARLLSGYWTCQSGWKLTVKRFFQEPRNWSVEFTKHWFFLEGLSIKNIKTQIQNMF